jgi:hypothetical protein
VQQRRALIVDWLKVGTALSCTRGVLKIGFPTTENHARDSLNRENQKKFLEAVASEIAGSPLRLELVIDASLAPPLASEMGFDLLDMPAAKPPAPAKAAPQPPATPPPSPVEPEAPPSSEADDEAARRMADFENDPLIKAAIAKFSLKLASRN